jgi:hypothetical protein
MARARPANARPKPPTRPAAKAPARKPKAAATPAAHAPWKHPTYHVHPGIAMVQDWIEALPARTGKSLPQWTAHIRKHGPAGEEARRAWLKSEHGFGANHAGWLTERSVGKGSEEDTPEGYLAQTRRCVESMYANKPALRPVHDALMALGASLGADVRFCPCKTIVPFYRTHVFAQIKPSTATRLDLGLCLTPLLKRGEKIPAPLIETGGFAKKDRITHRIPLAAPGDITAEVRRWLKRAYDLDVGTEAP